MSTTELPKPARNAFGRTTHCAWPPRSRSTEKGCWPPSSTAQKPGSLQDASEAIGAVSPEMPPRHYGYPLVGLHHQQRGPRQNEHHQHRIHADTQLAPIGGLQWAGSNGRAPMDNSRVPTAVFYGKLRQCKRDRGAHRRKFKDQVKRQLTQAVIVRGKWEQLTENRDKWRTTIESAASGFAQRRKTAAEKKR